MRSILVVLLAAGILPYLSYGHTPARADHDIASARPVCVTNLGAGAICELNVEPDQSMLMEPMVMIRGQLLTVR